MTGSNFDGRTRAISLCGIGGRHAGGFVGMAPGRTPLSGASDPRKRDGTIVRIGPARPFGRECSALALFARSLGVRSIGRAQCRERVCKDVWMSVVVGP